MKTQTIRIGGMTCVNCRNRIEGALKSTVGVEDAAVDYGAGTATVRYNPAVLTSQEIKGVIEQLGYTASDDGARGSPAAVAGTLAVILALYLLLRGLGLSTLTAAFPLAEAGMGYGMIFLIGLITSVHCAAMCGGLALSQSLSRPASGGLIAGPAGSASKAPRGPLLYNTGRVISYTLVGILVGALGGVVTLPGRLRGLVQLVAGAFMVIMGINMLGLFPALRRLTIRLPPGWKENIDKRRAAAGPFTVGLLNGLMPCGPLQAMQLYALSTGSPVAGGISMFIFSAGTVPLMFGIGALSSFLSAAAKGPAFTRRVMQVGAILVTVMGMTMFSYGMALSPAPGAPGGGFIPGGGSIASKGGFIGPEGGVSAGSAAPGMESQIVNSTLSPGRYPAITVQQGIPVKWTINAPAGSINGCNNRMFIREYGIEHRFKTGENIIEFIPERTGRFTYSCWMGMIRSSITVTEAGTAAREGPPGPASAETPPPGVPAGVTIPVESVALAEIQEEGYQRVDIALRDEGLEPAVIVVQRGIPALWIVRNDSLDPGNRSLIFPAYSTRLEMKQGDNVIELLPLEDFDFSTADYVFYGYVKVVADLKEADMEAIKAEVSEFEPLIYPEF